MHDALAVVGTVADRIDLCLHSSNLNVLQQVLPVFFFISTHMMLMAILGTKIRLATLAHRFEIFQNVVNRASELTCTATRGRWDEFLTTNPKPIVLCFRPHNAASNAYCKDLMNSVWSVYDGCTSMLA
jgi:hypothetical protein